MRRAAIPTGASNAVPTGASASSCSSSLAVLSWPVTLWRETPFYVLTYCLSLLMRWCLSGFFFFLHWNTLTKATPQRKCLFRCNWCTVEGPVHYSREGRHLRSRAWWAHAADWPLSLFIQSRVPAREWCHPQWAFQSIRPLSIPISVTTHLWPWAQCVDF